MAVESRLDKSGRRSVGANRAHKHATGFVPATGRKLLQQLAGNPPQTGLIDGMMCSHGFSLFYIGDTIAPVCDTRLTAASAFLPFATDEGNSQQQTRQKAADVRPDGNAAHCAVIKDDGDHQLNSDPCRGEP